MPTYVIVDLDVDELSALDEYRRQAVPLLPRYGGRPIIRFGATEVLEGDWIPKRLIGLEFADMEAVKRWWESDDYRPLKLLRQRCSKANVVAVNGL
jgi:uncharacterized protein (DUF1330 family)